jgi:hypothetical protein
MLCGVEPTERKEPYVRPELVEISLRAEEVLAVGCKTIPSSKVNRSASNCGIAVRCNQRGS